MKYTLIKFSEISGKLQCYETDYYATVNYRGKDKNYYVSFEEDNDIRIEYLDYNPEREWDGVWIKNGKDKIKTVFDKTTVEYKYYKDLEDEWDNEIEKIKKQHKRIWGKASLGTDHYKLAWRKAVNEVNKRNSVQLFPNQKIRE